MIELEGIRRDFGGLRAIDDLSLRVADGELHAFLGPNGAGKSTTLRILAGLLRPTSGRALVDGFDVVLQDVEVKRRIGYVPDTPYLHERLTVHEHLQLVAGLHGIPADRFRERAACMLAAFDIESRAGDLIQDLSHGMRQKLAFAGAFLPEPTTVIIDEPWVGLDPRSLRDVIDFLKQRNREGVTVLMSTHDLAIAERIADRISIVHRGRLVAEGTVAELLALRARGALLDLFLELTAPAASRIAAGGESAADPGSPRP